MKQLSKILIIIFIASTFNIAEAAEFSDEFAKNLLTCTEYGENYSSIQGYEKNKCVMKAEYYTCRLSTSQAEAISRAILKYNKSIS